MPLDHAKLVERIERLRGDKDRAVAQANAIAGALAEAEHLLALWDAPAAPAPEVNGHDVTPHVDAS